MIMSEEFFQLSLKPHGVWTPGLLWAKVWEADAIDLKCIDKAHLSIRYGDKVWRVRCPPDSVLNAVQVSLYLSQGGRCLSS